MPPEHPDNLKFRILVSAALVILFLLVGAGAFAALRSMKKQPKQVDRTAPLTVVRVQVAERATYRETLRGYGRARALRAADLSAEVAGVVSWISPDFESGNAVEKGAELLRLDRREYETALASAVARRAQSAASAARSEVTLENTDRRLVLARKDLEAAERELVRVQGLADGEVLTKSDLDRQRISKSLSEKEVVSLESQRASTEQELVSAKAEIEAADAAIERTKLDLERTTVRAPFAGRIEARFVSLGTRIAPGTKVGHLVDLSRVEVPVALGASHFGDVAPGSKASIRIGQSPETVWEGTVARVSPVVSDVDRTFSAYLVVTGTPLANPVPPGAFTLAFIEGRENHDVIPVPRSAFVGETVFLATEGGDGVHTVRTCRPEVSRLLPSVALVTGGLEPGSRVVLTNLEQVAAGSRVKIADEARTDRGGQR